VLDIKAELAAAQKDIAILGTLPLAIDSRDVQSAILTALRAQQGLSITVLCESDNDLFIRSLSCLTSAHLGHGWTVS